MILGIDPGHGGDKNQGKVVADTNGSWIEKDLTLWLAKQLQQSLQGSLLSRVQDETLSFPKRNERLRRAALILCIHFDSGPPSVNGTRLYTISPAARKVADEVAAKLRQDGRRCSVITPMEATYPRVLQVLKAFTAPTILCETAFLTNPDDRVYVSNGCPGFVKTVSACLKGLGFT